MSTRRFPPTGVGRPPDASGHGDNRAAASDCAGIGTDDSWYIDTNEMMHRSDVFHDLEYLWATRHPDREKINAGQLVRCVYRRHNDQELAERIIGRYGLSVVNKIDDILVEFFCAPRQHRFLSLRFQKEIDEILATPALESRPMK